MVVAASNRECVLQQWRYQKDFAEIRSFLPRKILKGKTWGFSFGFGFFVCSLGWVKGWLLKMSEHNYFDNVVCFPEIPWKSVQHSIIFMFFLEPTI